MTLDDFTSEQKKGARAEEVAAFYLRLNGFFTLGNFAVHHARSADYLKTEADLCAVRFPQSKEVLDGMPMQDDRLIVDMAKGAVLFLLCEVKSGLCDINPPWRDGETIAYTLGRMGVERESDLGAIADCIKRRSSWVSEDNRTRVHYVVFGSRRNPRLSSSESSGSSEATAEQIRFHDIATFLSRRFQQHPTKIPTFYRKCLRSWGDFGVELVAWIDSQGRELNAPAGQRSDAFSEAIESYINKGSLR